jgi:hypothetical protein
MGYMANKFFFLPIMIVFIGLGSSKSFAQDNKDSSLRTYKNVLRYNLSGALLFGFDKYVVLGYERVLSPKKSISVNFGTAALPKIVSLVTDSFQTSKEGSRKGYNLSIDYRFYLAKENKFEAPRGLYIGPYYSYNHYENEKEWTHKKNGISSAIMTKGDFNIHTFGFELGYQLLLWKRFSVDMVLVGPGVGFYKYKASYNANTNLSSGEKEQLFDAMQQLLEQKFPGMNYVFSDEKINADGVLKTRDIGYRYIVHIGYAF